MQRSIHTSNGGGTYCGQKKRHCHPMYNVLIRRRHHYINYQHNDGLV